MTHYVYGMADPLQCATIRYVGYTAISPESRLEEQIIAARTSEYPSPKSQWINSIIRMGKRPTIIILQYCTNRREGLTAEKFWILQGQLLGWELFNVSGFDEDYKPLKSKRKPEPEFAGDEVESFPLKPARPLTSTETEVIRDLVSKGKFNHRGAVSISAISRFAYGGKNGNYVVWIKEALGI